MKRDGVFLSWLVIIGTLCVFALVTPSMGVAATNVALGGTATQSSTYNGISGPQLAIDGITDGTWPTACTANAQPQDWWQVDLNGNYRIDSIVLWNRTDCCSDRLSNFKVSVLDAGLNVIWSGDYFTGGGYPNPSYTIALPSNTFGKFVKVSLNGSNWLQLAEVQVYGVPQSAVPAMSQKGIILLMLGGLAVVFIYLGKKRRA